MTLPCQNRPRIDDYAKDGGLGEVCILYSFYHETLLKLHEVQTGPGPPSLA